MTDNIIPFPNKRETLSPPTPEVITSETLLFDDRTQLEKNILDGVLIELVIGGYDIDTILEHQPKDLGLVIESIASLIDRYNLKPHYLHQISDHIFTATETGEVMVNDTAVISLDTIDHEGKNDIT